MTARRLSPAVIALALVAACGGGGGGGGGNGGSNPVSPPPSTTFPEGIYDGTLTICEVSGCLPHNYLFVVSNQGDYFAFDKSFELVPMVGLLDVSDSRFEGTRDVYVPTGDTPEFGFPPTNPPQAASDNASRGVRGSFVVEQSIEANYFHVSNLSDTQFRGSYDLAYEQASTMQRLAGMYSVDDGAGYGLTYVIDDAGAISGSDSTGCTVSGTFRPIRSDRNLYRTDLTFAACGANGANGAYRGLAILMIGTGTVPDRLYFYGANGAQVVLLELPRL